MNHGKHLWIFINRGSKSNWSKQLHYKTFKELFDNSDTKPAVNQVEFNPFNFHVKLLTFCKEECIKLEGYTPLSRTSKFGNKTIQEISKKYSSSPAQVMLRWAVQLDVIPIPKSSHRERIIENADIFNFNIEDEDMKKLNLLNENFRFAMDPSEIK